MNEDIKDLLVDNARGISEYVKQSKDFVLEQAPLYIQELCSIHFFDNAVNATVFALLTLITIGVCLGLCKSILKTEEDVDKVLCISLVIGLGTTFAGPMIKNTCDSVKESYKAVYAPRVLIMEKAADLVKEETKEKK